MIMERNKLLREIFVEAAEIEDDGARAAYLDGACAGDADLRERIETLLALESARDLPRDADSADLTDTDSLLGSHIGTYKVLERIGEGGCGVVYIVEQERPVRRKVALKIIKLGMDTRQVVARFEAERQALAMMDHPGIAKVFEAGATEAGRPYFVMELVRGIPLTDYCDHQQLGTRERLGLFLQVCHAVQHAHQKGIIHRDLKPSNVLVTEIDGIAQPRIIDFGIAKATEGRLTEATLFTAFEQMVGTPSYMSPEQTSCVAERIDTRSDIYSLGVLLYELTTGETPFDSRALLTAGLDAMRSTIMEKVPPRPSIRLGSMTHDELTTISHARGSEPPWVIDQIAGDLDWIIMKCLEKEPPRRYETANGLATDIQRHLQDEPVLARPASRLYLLRKSVRRNKLAYGATASVVIALAVGFVLASRQAARARRAEKE